MSHSSGSRHGRGLDPAQAFLSTGMASPQCSGSCNFLQPAAASSALASHSSNVKKYKIEIY